MRTTKEKKYSVFYYLGAVRWEGKEVPINNRASRLLARLSRARGCCSAESFYSAGHGARAKRLGLRDKKRQQPG